MRVACTSPVGRFHAGPGRPNSPGATRPRADSAAPALGSRSDPDRHRRQPPGRAPGAGDPSAALPGGHRRRARTFARTRPRGGRPQRVSPGTHQAESAHRGAPAACDHASRRSRGCRSPRCHGTPGARLSPHRSESRGGCGRCGTPRAEHGTGSRPSPTPGSATPHSPDRSPAPREPPRRSAPIASPHEPAPGTPPSPPRAAVDAVRALKACRGREGWRRSFFRPDGSG